MVYDIICLSQLRCDKHDLRLHNLIERNMTCNLSASLPAEKATQDFFPRYPNNSGRWHQSLVLFTRTTISLQTQIKDTEIQNVFICKSIFIIYKLEGTLPIFPLPNSAKFYI